MDIGLGLGLAGDIMTFSGSIVLAWDVVQSEQQFKKAKTLADELGNGWLDQLPLRLEGLDLKNKTDIQLAFIRRTSRKAMAGFILLVIGFALLLSSRVTHVICGLG